jgi:hypothetical protein
VDRRRRSGPGVLRAQVVDFVQVNLYFADGINCESDGLSGAMFPNGP